MNTLERIAVMQASVDGEEIEYKYGASHKRAKFREVT